LAFDKDDDLAMDFVSAASNLRMFVFSIPMQTHFQTKGIAGNIVHAIATTNAISAGLIVMEAIKVLTQRIADLRLVYLKKDGPKILHSSPCDIPRSNCIVCGGDKTVVLTINTHKFTLMQLFDKVLLKGLSFNEPSIDVVSSDNFIGTKEDHEEEDKTYLTRILSSPGVDIKDGSVLSVEDQSQTFNCTIRVQHSTDMDDEEQHPDGFRLTGKVTSDSANGNEETSTSAGIFVRSRVDNNHQRDQKVSKKHVRDPDSPPPQKRSKNQPPTIERDEEIIE